MLSRTVLLAMLCAVVPLAASAEEAATLDPAPAPAEAAAVKSPWSGELSAGYNESRGNTVESELMAGTKNTRKTDEHELNLNADAYYSSTKDKMNAQRYNALARFAQNFGESKRWFNSYALEANHDRFADIDYRLLPSVGIGYWFRDTDDEKLRAEAGLGWQYTKFRSGAADESDPVLVGKAFGEKTLVKGAKLSEDFSIWPNLGDVGEFRLKSDTSLTAPVTGSVSLRLSLIEEYLSNPAPGKRQNDLRIMSSAVYTY